MEEDEDEEGVVVDGASITQFRVHTIRGTLDHLSRICMLAGFVL